MAVDLDDVTGVRKLLAGAGSVLFDFDGPICRLFPDGSSKSVADELRETVDRFGAGDVLSVDERTHIDPHVVLRAVHRAARRDPRLSRMVSLLEAQVTAGEVAAASTAELTLHVDTVVELLFGRGVRLAVVTNNSPVAAHAYLRDHGLIRYFSAVEGRRPNDPGLMKPHPDVVLRALDGLHLPPRRAVMIGDTGTDLQAASRAGVSFIGYGRNDQKAEKLRDAGAEVVVGSYLPVLEGERGHGS
ncbi:HAD family hydrolase [Streptomyces sp. HUAS ZL42]|uniref:HAD family hydrolase n=1 Tax=Streptomyces sp. HUAS ZL42 TaxID=3231715 RepID=UPI00345E2E8B